MQVTNSITYNEKIKHIMIKLKLLIEMNN
jgi:hypothetical protein